MRSHQMTTRASTRTFPRTTVARRRRGARTHAHMSARDATATPRTRLRERLREIADLRSLEGLAGWDELVMMPSGDDAATTRARAMASLAGAIHEKATSASLGELLERVEEEGVEEGGTRRTRDAREAFDKATAIPAAMAKRKAALGSRGYQVWVKARESGEFSAFAPVLEEWVTLTREVCELTRPGGDVYDTALDDYERGMTGTRLREIFDVVREGVVPLIEKIYAKSGPKALEGRANPLAGEFDVDAQSALAKSVAVKLGFDLTKGRLDVSVHPFTGGCEARGRAHDDEVQIRRPSRGTERVHSETGHSLYEMGRSAEYAGEPVSRRTAWACTNRSRCSGSAWLV